MPMILAITCSHNSGVLDAEGKLSMGWKRDVSVLHTKRYLLFLKMRLRKIRAHHFIAVNIANHWQSRTYWHRLVRADPFKYGPGNADLGTVLLDICVPILKCCLGKHGLKPALTCCIWTVPFEEPTHGRADAFSRKGGDWMSAICLVCRIQARSTSQ